MTGTFSFVQYITKSERKPCAKLENGALLDVFAIDLMGIRFRTRSSLPVVKP